MNKFFSGLVHFVLAPFGLMVAIAFALPDLQGYWNLVFGFIIYYLACLRVWTWLAVRLDLLDDA